jgi:hypothetical protein
MVMRIKEAPRIRTVMERGPLAALCSRDSELGSWNSRQQAALWCQYADLQSGDQSPHSKRADRRYRLECGDWPSLCGSSAAVNRQLAAGLT